MNKRVIKYLNNKEKTNYTFLDKVLSFYTSGQFYDLLYENNVTEIEFFPSIRKNENSIQVYFNYYNLSAILEFKDEYYEYCKYIPGCSAEELENNIIKEQYNDEFNIESFINDFIKTIVLDEKMIKNKNSNIVKKSRKKLYSVISIVSLFIPWIILGMILLCSHLINKDIEIDAWFALIIIVSIVIWAIFDEKSKRIK